MTTCRRIIGNFCVAAISFCFRGRDDETDTAAADLKFERSSTEETGVKRLCTSMGGAMPCTALVCQSAQFVTASVGGNGSYHVCTAAMHHIQHQCSICGNNAPYSEAMHCIHHQCIMHLNHAVFVHFQRQTSCERVGHPVATCCSNLQNGGQSISRRRAQVGETAFRKIRPIRHQVSSHVRLLVKLLDYVPPRAF